VDHPGRARRVHHRQGAPRRHQGAAPRQVQVSVLPLLPVALPTPSNAMVTD
jgi:hypothetical protein